MENLEQRVQSVLDAYIAENDPEKGHSLEDDLLWDYINRRGALGDPDAVILLRIQIRQKKWFA
jgi:hypothetical protein